MKFTLWIECETKEPTTRQAGVHHEDFDIRHAASAAAYVVDALGVQDRRIIVKRLTVEEDIE